MASTNLSIKEAILASALSNAALLIAAPSLGCLRTYTKAFTDLCRAYGLNKPDLSHILKYSPTASLSSSTKSSKTECFHRETQVTPEIHESEAKHIEIKKEPEDFECDTINVTPDFQELNAQNIEIKKEYEDFECDAINVKCEISNKSLYNACLYEKNSTTQGYSLEGHIKNEATKLEIPLDITLEIPNKKKCRSKVAHTKASTNSSTLKKYEENKKLKLEASFDINSQKTANLSKVSSMDQACIKNKKTLQKSSTTYQNKPKLPPLQVDKTPDYEPAANADHYSAMFRDIAKSLTNSESSEFRDISSMLLIPKSSEYSTIEKSGALDETSIVSKVHYVCGTAQEIKDSLYGTPSERALDKTLNVSKVSLKGHNITKSQRTPNKISAIKEGKPKSVKVSKLSLRDQDKTKSKKYSKTINAINKGQSMIQSFQKNDTSSNSSVFSFLDENGRKQYTPSSKEATNKLSQNGMPIDFAIWNTDYRECLIYVDTPIGVPIRTSTLCILRKDEGSPIMISFADIREISQYNSTITVYYRSKVDNCSEHIGLKPRATKSRSMRNNISAIVNWLQNFLG